MDKSEQHIKLVNRDILVIGDNVQLGILDSDLSQHNWRGLSFDNIYNGKGFVSGLEIKVAIAIFSITNQSKTFKLIDKIKAHYKHLKWLAILVDYNKSKLDPLFTHYFIDFFHLPIDKSHLFSSLGHAQGMSDLNKALLAKLIPENEQRIIGNSKPMKILKQSIEKVSKVDNSVLLTGETGVGKDLCASIVHQKSSRFDGPFISINCGALPENLIHSELFGHEKGAFTGAVNKYVGHIEQAHNGTLLLDEIGDLPLNLQVNLLHFLEDHNIERLGSCKKINVNCRILAATHIDLETAIEEGNFREDLYHRLNIIKIKIPSLRERKEDIELLAKTFIIEGDNKNVILSDKALEGMLFYQWPGNVRELKNRLQRASVMSDSKTIELTDLGLNIKSINTGHPHTNNTAKTIDSEVLLSAIKRNNHNITAAAKELKISRTTFYRIVKRCNIKL